MDAGAQDNSLTVRILLEQTAKIIFLGSGDDLLVFDCYRTSRSKLFKRYVV